MKKYILLSSLFILPMGSAIFMIKDTFNFFGNKNKPKDETRFNSNYYGLNWGSRTDEIVNL
jgi:hypothetical protein